MHPTDHPVPVAASVTATSGQPTPDAPPETEPAVVAETPPGPRPGSAAGDEDGSLVTEYGLVAVIGATIAGLILRWASGGAITELLGAVLVRVKALVGV